MAGFRDAPNAGPSATAGGTLLFATLGGSAASESAMSGSFDFVPSAEVHDAEGRLTIRLELPGVDAGDISVSATDRLLEIRGEKRSDVQRRSGDHYATDRSFGAFSRGFALPYAIDPDRIEAGFDRGVLTITVDKPAGSRSQVRRIAIRSATATVT